MENSNQGSLSLTPEERIKEWEVDEKIAKKLTEHRSKPGKDDSNIVDYNDEIRNLINQVYPDGQKTWVEARYKDEDDEKRYCLLRKIGDEGSERGKKGKVKDYKTKIYKVKVGDKEDEEFYYDIATINPPPPID